MKKINFCIALALPLVGAQASFADAIESTPSGVDPRVEYRDCPKCDKRIRIDSTEREKMQRDVKLRAARTKAEYDELKSAYEVEFKDAQVKLAELKSRAEDEGKAIDSSMMTRYRQIKQHVMPPMAKLNGDRCGGCNMSLPAATRNHLNSGEEIVECDNCGRILFVPTAQ